MQPVIGLHNVRFDGRGHQLPSAATKAYLSTYQTNLRRDSQRGSLYRAYTADQQGTISSSVSLCMMIKFFRLTRQVIYSPSQHSQIQHNAAEVSDPLTSLCQVLYHARKAWRIPTIIICVGPVLALTPQLPHRSHAFNSIRSLRSKASS